MPKDKEENHKKILAAAREEFLAKGFEKASIREIGRKAGVTSAALYRHCRDKEELFSMVADEAIQALNQWESRHAESNISKFNENCDVELLFCESEIDLVRNVMFPRKEVFKMILTQSKGTRYENFLHDKIVENQKVMMMVLDLFRQRGFKVANVTEKEMHTILSAYYTAMLEPIVHDYSREEMEHCLRQDEQFFMPGWKKMLGL